MGFIPDIENICTKLPATRQTLLFSATMPPPIKKLADRFLTNPKSIEVARPATAGANIAQMLVPVDERKKREMLRSLLRSEDVNTAIIFCNRKTMVRELNKSLKRHGFKSGEIHGDIDQAARIAELDRFKSGEINLLVASDVAARGLDIKGVSHVFNFDAPWHPDDYVHRIGRTGRAGASGKAFTFVTRSDAEAIENIEKLIGTKIPRLDTGVAIDNGDEAAGATARGRNAKPAPARRGGKAPAKERDEDKPARTVQPERTERAPSEDKAKRPARTEPAEKAGRTEKAAAKPAPRIRQQADNEPDDGGWNGPTPAFLSFGIGD